MNDHTQRIIRIMQDKKMNPTQFSEAIGIQRAAMSHITLGRNNPSADVITKIINRFEDINPGWLLTGKGTMKISSENQDGGLFGGNPLPSERKDQSDLSFDHKNQSDLPSNRKSQSDPPPFDRKNRPDPPYDPENRSENENVTKKTPFSAIKNDLFQPPISFEEEPVRTEKRHSDQIYEREEVNQPNTPDKVIEKEIIIYKDKPLRTVEKLVIFYSDRTYETFHPE